MPYATCLEEHHVCSSVGDEASQVSGNVLNTINLGVTAGLNSFQFALEVNTGQE